MRTFILPSSYNGENSVEINGKEFRYLVKVLRLKEGASFAGRDRVGNRFNLTLTHITAKSCQLSCTPIEGEFAPQQQLLPQLTVQLPRMHLYIGLCKGKKLDQIVRQAAEIGTASVHFVKSSFTVVEQNSLNPQRFQRFETLVKEALQQSGSALVTHIAEILPLDEITDNWQQRGPLFLFHEKPSEASISPLKIIRGALQENPSADIAVIIGSEGGFSDQEVALLKEQGATSVHFDTNILRSETAAIYALSVVQSIYTDMLHI